MTITFKGIADPSYTLVVDNEHVISYTRPVLVMEDVKIESFNNVTYHKTPMYKDVVLLIDADAPQAERLIGLQVARQISYFEQTNSKEIKPYKFDVVFEFDFDEGKIIDKLHGCFLANLEWNDMDVIGDSKQIQITLRYDNYTT